MYLLINPVFSDYSGTVLRFTSDATTSLEACIEICNSWNPYFNLYKTDIVNFPIYLYNIYDNNYYVYRYSTTNDILAKKYYLTPTTIGSDRLLLTLNDMRLRFLREFMSNSTSNHVKSFLEKGNLYEPLPKSISSHISKSQEPIDMTKGSPDILMSYTMVNDLLPITLNNRSQLVNQVRLEYKQ